MTNKFFDFFLKHKIVLVIFLIGLVYVALPGAQSIDDFPGLKPSVKSDLPGDTWQNPNISAYFSDYDRAGITDYYKNFFSKTLLFGISLPVVSINHRPESAYQYVRDQQESTFLEEYIFPMRDSIFVNGYEPAVENERFKRVRTFIGDNISYKDGYYASKTTLRYYPSNVFLRIFAYLGIWVAIFGIKEITMKLIKEK